MPDLLTRAAAGAAAGFVATGPMTLAFAAARATLPEPEQYPLPPRIVTERAARAAGVSHRLDEPETQAATTAAHFGFGAATGAVFGALAPCVPLPPVASGIAYGLGVWAASYVGWLPAAGLHPPAHRERAGRNAMNIGAHIVWGAVLGLLTDQLAGSANGGEEAWRPAMTPEVVAAG